MKILLIEPDRVLARTYARALSAAGHEDVMLCSDAQSAILSADRETPDLVILELQLVEHSGIEFLYEFRSYPEWQAIPVMVHSVVSPSEFKENRELLNNELGVSEYLYKPRASLSQLIEHVNRLTATASK